MSYCGAARDDERSLMTTESAPLIQVFDMMVRRLDAVEEQLEAARVSRAFRDNVLAPAGTRIHAAGHCVPGTAAAARAAGAVVVKHFDGRPSYDGCLGVQLYGRGRNDRFKGDPPPPLLPSLIHGPTSSFHAASRPLTLLSRILSAAALDHIKKCVSMHWRPWPRRLKCSDVLDAYGPAPDIPFIKPVLPEHDFELALYEIVVAHLVKTVTADRMQLFGLGFGDTVTLLVKQSMHARDDARVIGDAFACALAVVEELAMPPDMLDEIDVYDLYSEQEAPVDFVSLAARAGAGDAVVQSEWNKLAAALRRRLIASSKAHPRQHLLNYGEMRPPAPPPLFPDSPNPWAF